MTIRHRMVYRLLDPAIQAAFFSQHVEALRAIALFIITTLTIHLGMNKIGRTIRNSPHGEDMPPSLSSSAQKIQDLLTAQGYDLVVIEHSESTRTAQEAADRAGCALGQITKSLIFRGKTSGKPILVLTSGANRVDEKLLAGYSGESVGRADADFVREVTGFAIGGVPPLGHLKPMEIFLDEDLLQYETIWAAAGTPNAIFELTPSQLQALTGGRPVRVKPPA